MKTLTLDGSRFSDIASFYDEINRVFMGDEDWQLGPSLDALDDMLYGAYGAAQGNAPVQLVWLHFDKSRHDLGTEATRQWHLGKLSQPGAFQSARINEALAALDDGTGPCYIDIVLDIIASHPRIHLVRR